MTTKRRPDYDGRWEAHADDVVAFITGERPECETAWRATP